MVEDHETGVEPVAAPERLDLDRIRVPTEVVIGLEDVDFVVCGQHPGRQHAADAGSDDGDLHRDPPVQQFSGFGSEP